MSALTRLIVFLAAKEQQLFLFAKCGKDVSVGVINFSRLSGGDAASSRGGEDTPPGSRPVVRELAAETARIVVSPQPLEEIW